MFEALGIWHEVLCALFRRARHPRRRVNHDDVTWYIARRSR